MHYRNILILTLLCLLFYLPGLTTIPPIDRDESRFAQASKQMIESQNFIDIRFQETPRYKKPIGTYWLQTASVSMFSSDSINVIWVYRIPSVMAAVLAVIFTYFLANLFISTSGALAAGVLLSTSILLVAEAHMAKSDALLLMSIVISQYGLASAYQNKFNLLSWLSFWIGLGLGIMIKGPLAPLITIMTIVGLWAFDRNIKWCTCLKPTLGLLIIGAMCLPWIIAIQMQSSGAFLQASLGDDLIPKLLGGMESHGHPPGYYLILVMLTFWPGSLFLFHGFKIAIRSRLTLGNKFLLAWLIPTWILFELVPTKLPHYVLPVYPALAIIAAHCLMNTNSQKTAASLARYLTNFTSIMLSGFWLLLGIVFFASSMFMSNSEWVASYLNRPFNFPDKQIFIENLGALEIPLIIASSTALLIIFVSMVLLMRRRTASAIFGSITAAALLILPLLQWTIPELKWLFPSTQVAEVVHKGDHNKNALVAVGYHEPSLVFLNGTDTFLSSTKEGANFFTKQPNSYAVVSDIHLNEFLEASRANNVVPKTVEILKSFNYSKGRPLNLHILSTE